MLNNCFIFLLYCSFLLCYVYNTNAAVSRKFLEEFRSHSRVWLHVYKNQNHPITSTYNTLKFSHEPHIRVEFVLDGLLVTLELKLNSQLFSPKYMERIADGAFVEAKTNNCYYVGKVYLENKIKNNTNTNTFKNNNNNNNKNNTYYNSNNNNRNNKNNSFKNIKNDKVLLENSNVAVSSCAGLRGWVWLDGRSLHIEPEQRGLIGWYVIADDAHSNQANKLHYQTHAVDLKIDEEHRRRLKEQQGEKRRMKRTIDWPYDHDNQTLIIELFIVNDRAQYVKQGSSVERVTQRTKDVVNIVNSLYRPLNIYIALVGLEIWRDHDRMNPATSTNMSLELFLTYREHSINYAVHNDNAQLISGKVFNREDGEGVVGRAPIMTMCSWKYSGGINMDHSETVGRLAVTMAHELGHNLGMIHDAGMVGCPDETCIMSAFISNKINPNKWSEGSKDQLRDSIHLHIHYCLHNLPSSMEGGSSCGNGFVDEGEDCDCGLPKDCTSACCEVTTCRFKPAAVCATGTCCLLDTCQLRPAHHECRPISDSCDLPEFCNGVNETCPGDVYKHNGVECSVQEKDAYCYDGECRNHDTQCRLLWGSTGVQSHTSCYSTFNPRGKVEGNCGSHFDQSMSQKFLPCNQSDILCGMLHCEHQNEKLMFWKESTTYQLLDSHVEDSLEFKRRDCKGVVYDMGVHMDNPGMVPNGAVCGVGKMCASQRCRDLQEYEEDLKCQDCHGNGICNSIGQCHCNHGYAPPDCLGYGLGGSLHSNSAHHAYSSVGRTIGITILVLLILLAILFIALQLFKRRNFILKEFSLSSFKSTEGTKNNYYKQKQQLQKQQQPLPQLPTGFVTSSAASRSAISDLPTAALLSKPPPKMPLPQIPDSSHFDPQPPSTVPYQLPPPRRPPKMKLSSTSFSSHRKMTTSEESVTKSESTDLKQALRDLNDIDFINEPVPANRTQPFRKAPPPPPQSANQDEEEDEEVKVHNRPTVVKRNLGAVNTSNNLNMPTSTKPRSTVVKTSKNLSNPKISTTLATTISIAATLETTTSMATLNALPSTTLISKSNTNLNRRSKVLSKPSIKPPPPPKPKI